MPCVSERRACRSGIARGRKRCGKSISEGCVCRLERTEGRTVPLLRARIPGRVRAGGQGALPEVYRSPDRNRARPSLGGARRKSALGSAVHHFGCAEVIPCSSRKRRDARDILLRSDLSLFFSLFLILLLPLYFSIGSFSASREERVIFGEESVSRRRWHGDQLDRPTDPVHRREGPGTFRDVVTSPTPRDWSHFYALHAGRSGSPAGNWVTASLPLEFLLRSSPGGFVLSCDGTEKCASYPARMRFCMRC